MNDGGRPLQRNIGEKGGKTGIILGVRRSTLAKSRGDLQSIRGPINVNKVQAETPAAIFLLLAL
jgi:hypothetical protein